MSTRLTLDDAKKLAREREGNCISEIFLNGSKPLNWKCKDGHTWLASYNQLKYKKSWCPTCSHNRTKLNILLAREIARDRNGKCLSTSYKNINSPLLWSCKFNHQWYAPLNRIKNRGLWCPKCRGYGKTIIDMQKLAQEKNGRCLSDTYRGVHIKILWECEQKHQWMAIPRDIRRGHWCPYCSGLYSCSLELAKQIADAKNGECLSTNYKNIDSPLLWSCEFNHQWYAPLYRVKNLGTWCPTCYGYYKTIDDAHKFAKDKQGKCLSNSYKNVKTNLLWQCEKNHIWSTSFNNVKNNRTWCPYCAKKAPHTIEEAKQIAFNRNGRCLSMEYIDGKSPLLWICKNQHQWYASFSSVVNQNSWCPFCRWKRQELCREIIIKYLGSLPSKNRRPDFLKTAEHPCGLELDIPYYEFGFAIEVQGIQHERFHPFFHKNQEEFEKQKERDQLKKDICEENWIVLIEVWYFEDPRIVIPQRLQELGLIP